MTHFVNVCEYGHTHGQCRCVGKKDIKFVKCDNPKHPEKYGPYASNDVAAKPDMAKVAENIRLALDGIVGTFSRYAMTDANATVVYASTMRDIFAEVDKIRNELNNFNTSTERSDGE